MIEHDGEPIPGLPGMLPAGERIVWQGSPDRRALARAAFHTRLISGYFALLTAVAAAFAVRSGSASGVVITAMLGVVVVALLHLLAWGSARTTIYTLTNRRIVLRVGMAVPKCLNLPLALIASVDLAARAGGVGDVPLSLAAAPKLGYLALWPHARPFRFVRPEPMLRAVPDAAGVAALIGRACMGISPSGRLGVPEALARTPTFAAAQAA